MKNEFQNINWEISSEEKRNRNQKTLFKFFVPAIALGIIASTIGYPFLHAYQLLTRGLDFVLMNVLYTILGITIAWCILFFANKFIPYPKRMYVLKNSGIIITKGNKEKYYPWSDFENFYSYSRRYINNSNKSANNSREKLFNSDIEITGQIFYLKKKNYGFLTNFYNKFVVVYCEPENSNSVSDYVSRYIPKKQMKSSSDLGMVFYEFK